MASGAGVGVFCGWSALVDLNGFGVIGDVIRPPDLADADTVFLSDRGEGVPGRTVCSTKGARRWVSARPGIGVGGGPGVGVGGGISSVWPSTISSILAGCRQSTPRW